MRRLSIGYVCAVDPRDRFAWSGAHHYMAAALAARGATIVHIGRSLDPRPGPLARLASRLLRRRGGHGAAAAEERPVAGARRNAAVLQAELRETPCDVLFAPVASELIAFLETDVPVAYLSDATFRLLRSGYPEIEALAPDVAAERELLEARAIGRAQRLFYSSAWAAESAVRDYGADARVVRVIPMGANLDDVPVAAGILAKPRAGGPHLLFIGRQWLRKGGDVALETVAALRALGLPARLTICGARPPGGVPPHVTVAGTLGKHRRRDRARLDALLRSAHFLVLPSRADCTPFVCSEANAYGVPVVASDTGGLRTLIDDGHNGYLVPAGARGDHVARRIADVWGDEERYAALVRSSRGAFEDRLSWAAWADAVHAELCAVTAARRAA